MTIAPKHPWSKDDCFWCGRKDADKKPGFAAMCDPCIEASKEPPGMTFQQWLKEYDPGDVHPAPLREAFEAGRRYQRLYGWTE